MVLKLWLCIIVWKTEVHSTIASFFLFGLYVALFKCTLIFDVDAAESNFSLCLPVLISARPLTAIENYDLQIAHVTVESSFLFLASKTGTTHI